MSTKRTPPAITFANKHITSDMSTFDASSAIARLELLLDDNQESQKILEPILEDKWQPAFFEFVALYQVAFVTCLEWHAKSRIFDLFVFEPTEITTNDIKQGFSDSNIVQMVHAELTVPHLIVSSFNVSSIDRYVHLIDRVLTALGSGSSTSKIMASISTRQRSVSGVMAELFNSRNSLVHEISLQDIGHRNIRDFRNFNDIQAIGETALELIKAVELEITKCAPTAFPNLLDKEGIPISFIDRVSEEISLLEKSIEEQAYKEDNLGNFNSMDWISVTKNSKAYLNSELEFIESLELAGWQYHDIRPKLKAELLDHRLSFLKSLANEIAPTNEA